MSDIWARVDEAIDTDPLLLRGLVRELLARAEKAEETLRRVRDHHQPETPPDGQQWVSGGRRPHCAGCATGDPYLDPGWPCDTVRLLDGEDLAAAEAAEEEPEEVTVVVRGRS